MGEERPNSNNSQDENQSIPAGEGSGILLQLVAQCIERYEEEGEKAVESICRENPEHAEAIRRRIAYLREMGLLEGEATAQEGVLPERLGDFRLIRRLGGGGMGVVYEAEQEPLERRVALKLVRPEYLFFPGPRERFQREAEAVARLKHPGIVPIYTVGEEKGLPYIAMELVDGCTMAEVISALEDQHLESLSGLDLARNIARSAASDSGISEETAEGHIFSGSWMEACFRLIRQAADALDHAHRRGVIHRDIKPSNLMVTSTGRVMLLDFGLARAEGFTRMTRTGSQLGSLPYMSPEQIQGDPSGIDSRTDIYSLGVTLYELLTLQLPYSDSSSGITRQKILDGRPEPIRRFDSTIPWDAETVCLTAMERNPARRYASAADLARDLANVLEHRPIEARRPGIRLRTKRWVQRHPTATVALVLGIILLVGVPISVAMQQYAARVRVDRALEQAKTERDRAEKNFQKALEAVDRLLSRVGQTRLANEPRMDQLRRELLEDALMFYQDFLEQKGNDPEVRYETGRAYWRVGLIQKKLGRDAEAERALKEAIQIQTRLTSEYGSEPKYKAALADACNNLGNLLSSLEQPEKAIAAYEQVIQLRFELMEEFPDVTEHKEALATTYNNLGARFYKSGKCQEAEREYDRALIILDELANDFYDRYDLEERRAMIRHNLGLMQYASGRFPEAVDNLREAAYLQEDLILEFPEQPSHKSGLAATLSALARVLGSAGDLKEAEAAVLKALYYQAELVEDFPDQPDYIKALALMHDYQGLLFQSDGRFQEAEGTLRHALDVSMKLVEKFPDRPVYCSEHAEAYNSLGVLLNVVGEHHEAHEAFKNAYDLQAKLVREYPENPNYRSSLARSHINLGMELVYLKRFDQAEEHYLKSLHLRRVLARASPENSLYQQRLANSHNQLGTLLQSQDRLEEAESHHRKALDIRVMLAREYSDRSTFLRELAQSHDSLGLLLQDKGSFPEAEEEFAQALALCERLARDAPDLADYQSDLGRTKGNIANLHLLRNPEALLEVREMIEGAMRHQRNALNMNPKHPVYLSCYGDHLLVLGKVLAGLEDHEEVANTVEELVEFLTEGWEGIHEAARLLARCVDIAEKDLTLSEADRAMLPKVYSQRAMELLREAVQRGYNNLDDLEQNHDFDSLRSREDFQQLLKELKAKPAAPASAERKQ
ncbi:MAG: protein kinase domain-containing protein [Planctomycetota bacterium]|jgi:serine/threonine protein kinase/tetratricopeptide (TPR) repeat protein